MWIHKEESVDLVSLERIDITDRYYSITPCPFNEERLINSIRSIGIRVPVLLEIAAGERLRIVSGFRRIDALRELGTPKVPATIKKKEDPRGTFWDIVRENMGHRDLHDIERAEIIFKMRTLHGLENQEILTDCLPELGLRGSSYELQRMMSLSGLELVLKRACLDGRLLPSTALEIKNWPTPEAEFIVSLIDSLRLGTNKQKELVRLAGDLKRIEKKGLADVWGNTGLAEIPADELAFDTIKEALSKARFPELSKQIEKWNALREKLALSPGIQLQVPRYFEGEAVSVSFKASNPGEFRELAEELQKISRKAVLEEIFDLL